ncbi:V-type proton ATPase subunit e 1-like [Patiria miniata]|uniref:V-type proton ATPase subunit n=1 Tax=Patiria miniata TaxID=46514 RepID=A0A914B5Q2_PATMI|nr:V-type proton ATPase subunit e 1-like [Patiria miniata]
MASAWITLLIVTVIWAFIGIVLPFVVPRKRADRGIIQLMLALTAFCCYLFWLCTFLMQLNPLFGPQLKSEVIKALYWEWDNGEIPE